MNRKNLVNTVLFSVLTAGCTSNQGKYLYPEKDCNIELPVDESLQPYADLILDTPGLSEAINLCDSTESFRETLWSKIRTAEQTKTSPAGKLPESFQTAEEKEYFIPATAEEAEDVYAAHVAHSLWLDKSEVLPWKLADYNEDELKELFDPLTWFWKFSPEEEKFEFGYLVDNSPVETFEVVKRSIDLDSLTDQKEALVGIIKALRYYRHYNGDTDYCGDSAVIDTVSHLSEEKISRFGCQSMAAYLVNLAAAINIPGMTERGYYGGVGHRTALFRYTDDVLAHGGDVYSHPLWNTPSA